MRTPDLDPIIHQATRLGIVTALYKNRELAFTTLRDALSMTDGNLASHLSRLEEAGYVKSGRVLVGVSFEVHVKITDQGSVAFRSYLAALRAFLEQISGSDVEEVPGGRNSGATIPSTRTSAP